MRSWTRSGAWIGGSLLLLACSKPNPAFFLDQGGGTAGTDSETMSSGTASTVDPTDPTATATATTVDPTTTEPTTATTTGDPTATATTVDTTTTEPTTTTTDTDTEGPDELELCKAALEEANALILLDMHATCASATWGYAYSLGDDFTPISCPYDDLAKAVIKPAFNQSTSSGTPFMAPLSVTPAKGTEGLVQGTYEIAVPATGVPCLHTLISYPDVAFKQEILAQIRVGLAGTEPNIDLTNGYVPFDQLIEVLVPIPAELRGETIELLLVTIKEAAPAESAWTLLWERPIVYQAL